jgi:cell division protein FtsQ
MDPRIRARRVAVMRAAGRRRLHRLMVLVGVLAFGLTALGVSYSPALAVRTVSFEGATATDEAVLREAAGIRSGSSLVWLDVDAVRGRLEALPGVEAVRVRRSWPHGVVIEVDERVPAAIIADGAGSWVQVDEGGRVLATVASPGGLVQVQGAGAPGAPGSTLGAEGRALAQVAGSLPPSLRARVRAVAAAADGPVLVLRTGGTVVLHGTADLPAKLLAAMTVLRELEPDEVGELDVGVPDAPVLRRAAT